MVEEFASQSDGHRVRRAATSTWHRNRDRRLAASFAVGQFAQQCPRRGQRVRLEPGDTSGQLAVLFRPAKFWSQITLLRRRQRNAGVESLRQRTVPVRRARPVAFRESKRQRSGPPDAAELI